MSNIVGSWGVFPWNPEHGLQHIHVEDMSLAESYLPSICVFTCVDEKEGFIVLQYKQLNIRVRPELYQQVSEPVSKIGDRVRILSGSSQGKEGVVENLTWHFKNGEVMYALKIGGKLSSRQYVASDFEPAL